MARVTQKFLDTLNGQRPWLNGRMVVATVLRGIFLIKPLKPFGIKFTLKDGATFCLFVAAMELIPISVKAQTLAPGENPSELADGGIVLGVGVSQQPLDTSGRVSFVFDVSKFVSESSPEFSGGNSKPVDPGIPKRDITAKAGEQHGSGYLPEVFYEHAKEFCQGALYGLIAIWVMWMSGSFSPNAELSRVAASEELK